MDARRSGQCGETRNPPGGKSLAAAIVADGELPERTNGTVSKTVEVQASKGSNPLLSATENPWLPLRGRQGFSDFCQFLVRNFSTS